MCGIAGVVGLPDQHAVRAMIDAQQHRGPNDRGLFTDGFLSLGMCRLSILDVSPAGHQPMANADQTVWIVYNGELYNFHDERRLLEARGHRFRSNSDTEVVLAMYQEYGDDFLLRLRGMFALAIYDVRQNRKLLLARDQLGIKPLLYAKTPFGFVFASEMKAILASGRIEREIDPDGLRKLLTYGSIYQPSTLIEGVAMLLPAHRLIYADGQLRQERYWRMAVDRRPDVVSLPYEEQVDAVAAAVQESLKLYLVSDVPVGAFLSGGVDSTYLVAHMARAIGTHVKTFSIGYDDADAGLDESHEAEMSARRLGTDHTSVTVSGRDVRDAIDGIALALDQPTVDGVNSFLVSQAAAQHVAVAISGTGGDELFAGYPWFRVMEMFERQAPSMARFSVKGFLRKMLRRLIGRQCRANFLQHYFECYHLFEPAEARRLLAPSVRPIRTDAAAIFADLDPTDELPDAPAIERVSALCLRGYTNNQLLRDVDAASMAHSLEVRVPFLDVPLLDLALSLPSRTKMGPIASVEAAYRGSYRETGGKRILIDAGKKAGLLPSDIDLQPKRGFTMPFDRWLHGPLRDVAEDCLSSRSLQRRGLIDPFVGSTICDEYYRGRRPWNHVWSLMLLEVWCRAVVDRAVQPLRRAG